MSRYDFEEMKRRIAANEKEKEKANKKRLPEAEAAFNAPWVHCSSCKEGKIIAEYGYPDRHISTSDMRIGPPSDHHTFPSLLQLYCDTCGVSYYSGAGRFVKMREERAKLMEEIYEIKKALRL